MDKMTFKVHMDPLTITIKRRPDGLSDDAFVRYAWDSVEKQVSEHLRIEIADGLLGSSQFLFALME